MLKTRFFLVAALLLSVVGLSGCAPAPYYYYGYHRPYYYGPVVVGGWGPGYRYGYGTYHRW